MTVGREIMRVSEGLKGRCLCGSVRYQTGSPPLWVTVCHCRFCQRATGADRMVQPVFAREEFRFEGENPAVYSQPSEGSGKAIEVHFCARCGTKLALTFERWPNKIGVYAGTLDDPAAAAVAPEQTKHIFVAEAPPGTILPPGVKVYDHHAMGADGQPVQPHVHTRHFIT